MRLPPFQRLLDEHRDVIYRYCLVAVGPNEAEDCFQEVWLSALRAYPNLRSVANLRGWLLTIARNKALDSHRARQRRPTGLEAWLEQPAAGAEPAARDDDLWAAVRALPAKQRSAVVRRVLGDEGYAELSDALGVSEDAARQNVHTGLKRLREVVER